MKVLVLLGLFLVGCASPFIPEEATEFNEYLVLRIVIKNDLSWKKLDALNKKARGYADCKKGVCTLYLPDRGKFADCIWLHEIKDHAVYGMEHDENYFAC